MQVAVGDEAWYGSAACLGSVLKMPASRPPRTEARREDRRLLWARLPAATDGADDGGGAWGFLVLSERLLPCHTAAFSERLAGKHCSSHFGFRQLFRSLPSQRQSSAAALRLG